MEKKLYFCDVTVGDKPCAKETRGIYVIANNTNAAYTPTRYDLCDYHAAIFAQFVRGSLYIPRDPAEAACP